MTARRLGLIALVVGLFATAGAVSIRAAGATMRDATQKLVLQYADGVPQYLSFGIPRWCDLAVLGAIGLIAAVIMTSPSVERIYGNLKEQTASTGGTSPLTTMFLLVAMAGGGAYLSYRAGGMYFSAETIIAGFLFLGIAVGTLLNLMPIERRQSLMRVMFSTQERFRMTMVGLTLIMTVITQAEVIGASLGFMLAGIGTAASLICSIGIACGVWIAVHAGLLPGLIVFFLRMRQKK